MGRFGNSGRGGHAGRGSSSGRSQGRTKNSRSLTIEYKFSVQTGKGLATYASVKEKICEHVQKTYEHGGDISTALDEGTDYDFDPFRPKLVEKIDPKSNTPIPVTEGEKMDYRIEAELFFKRKSKYDDNKQRAFALIWIQYCLQPLDTRIKETSLY